MTDRGEYRAVRRVLLDGPDFQQLSERARFVFLALKLNFGPAGIEVWYPGELDSRIGAQTGMPAAAVSTAFEELQCGGWIEREGNVVWIIGQLDHDPHIKATDKKHRTMMENHVNGLPRIGIVCRFVLAHRQWFTEDGTPSGTPAKALQRVLEGPTEALRSTENREQKTDNKTEDRSSAPQTPARGGDTWLTPYADVWSAKFGGDMPMGPAAKVLKPLEAEHGPAEVLRRWRNYIAIATAEHVNPSRFASTFGRWNNATTSVDRATPGETMFNRIMDGVQ